ncbi:MAG: hypothetical protein AB7P03_09735 [Kofleriaceae bacterium]
MRESVDPWVLSQTLRNPGPSRQRLVSLLISRAQLDPDDGALALSEQLGYPAALVRHLERRDSSSVQLIPKELSVRWCVLPLGRAHDERLVVIARDPTPILQAALEHAIQTAITLAVVPGLHLEHLLRSIHSVEHIPEESVAQRRPSVADIGALTLDPDQPPTHNRARTVSRVFPISETTPELPPLRNAFTSPRPLERMLEDVDRAITLGAVERLVMSYAASRWRAALLFVIDEGRAVGLRGHGGQLDGATDIAVQLDAPSILQRAAQTRTATTEAPASEIQRELGILLGGATNLAAAPVIVSNQLHGMLLVGDARPEATGDSLGELTRIVDALAGAHERFARGTR